MHQQTNRDVERKWFDSLIGFDEQRENCRSDASPKEKYGILNVPKTKYVYQQG